LPLYTHTPDVSTGIEPNQLYTYVEIADFAGLDGDDEQKHRRVKRWVTEGKIGFTPLPGGRGRRIAGWQWIADVRNGAVEAGA